MENEVVRCKQCGRELTVAMINRNRKYCSTDCSKIYYSNQYKQHKNIARQEERVCARCGGKFAWSSSKPSQKYCNKECARLALEERCKRNHQDVEQETRRCTYCNTEFTCNKSSNKKYCKEECLKEAALAKYKEKNPNFGLKETRRCAYCDAEFTCNKSITKKYCSGECLKLATYASLKETRRCAYCNTEFTCNKSSTKTYCSGECLKLAIYARIKYSKEEKREEQKIKDEQLRCSIYIKCLDIISMLNQSKGATFNGKYIDYTLLAGIPKSTREFVLDRDNHECQVCGRKDSLHIHHLIKRRNGGNHGTDNLITLCASCHGSIETGDMEIAVNNCFKNAKKYGKII